MADQTKASGPSTPTPTVSNHPDYSGLQQASSTGNLNQAVGEALDEALPDDPQNPTLWKLKSIVRQSMMQSALASSVAQAMIDTASAIYANPALANKALVNSLMHTAIYGNGGRLTSGNFDRGKNSSLMVLATLANVRPDLVDSAMVKNLVNLASNTPGSAIPGGSPLDVLEKIAENRPDLLTSDVVKTATQSAVHDPDLMNRVAEIRPDGIVRDARAVGEADSYIRRSANNVLAQIAAKRPDLIDADMARVVSHTAAEPIANNKQPSSSLLIFAGDRSLGTQRDDMDNEARATAQETQKIIAERRPDLVGTSKPDAMEKQSPIDLQHQTGSTASRNLASP